MSVFCTLQSSTNVTMGPFDAQHTPFSPKVLALSTSYTMTQKSFLQFGEEIMQKEHELCSISLKGIMDSNKGNRQSRASLFTLKKTHTHTQLENKVLLLSHERNAHWYLIHLFIGSLCPNLDSRWELEACEETIPAQEQ